nr:hydroxcinnamoyl-CoA quinate/shikimate hydroxycinnamoyltransferase [Tanacetum cinerariifolium]
AGKLQSNPAVYATKTIHDAIAQRNNNSLKSAIDYLELVPDLDAIFPALELKCPNVIINSWTRFRIHEADFGWGQPIFMGPAYFPVDGMCFMLPASPVNNGIMSIAISLHAHQMMLFEECLYDI